MRKTSMHWSLLVASLLVLAVLSASRPTTPRIHAQSPAASATPSPVATPSPTRTSAPKDGSPQDAEQWLVRVDFATRAQLNHLAAAYDLWEVHEDARGRGGGWAQLLVNAQDVARLRLEGFRPVRTVQPGEASPNSTQGAIFCGETLFANLPCYRTVEQTYADLSDLARTHPNLAQWVDIGDSWEKSSTGGAQGYDLHALVLTNRSARGPKFRFALMAAIHARELATAELAARFAESLVAGYGTNADMTWLLDYGEIHVIALANPDGRKRAEAGQCWRKNTNGAQNCQGLQYGGVDLNRNSSFMWDQCTGTDCSSSNLCSPTYRGASAASEPETIAIQNYLASLYADSRGAAVDARAPADTAGLFVSLHSYASVILYPWGWTGAASPNHAELQTLADKFGYYTGYRACQTGSAGCMYNADGLTDDWLYGERGIASFTFEIGTAFFQACSAFEEHMLGDLSAALLYAFKAARRPYQTPAGPEPVNVAITPAVVLRGEPLTLTVTLDTTRWDDNGGRRFDEAVTPTTVSNASYWLDAPSWEGGMGLPLLPADGVYDEAVEAAYAVLDSSQLALGRHSVFVEGVANTGQNGVPAAVYVEVVAEAPPAPTAVPEVIWFPTILTDEADAP